MEKIENNLFNFIDHHKRWWGMPILIWNGFPASKATIPIPPDGPMRGTFLHLTQMQNFATHFGHSKNLLFGLTLQVECLYKFASSVLYSLSCVLHDGQSILVALTSNVYIPSHFLHMMRPGREHLPHLNYPWAVMQGVAMVWKIVNFLIYCSGMTVFLNHFWVSKIVS